MCWPTSTGPAPATDWQRRSTAASSPCAAPPSGSATSPNTSPGACSVTTSTALPGLVSTHSINGTSYINGGVRSNENADLASGYANVATHHD